MSTPPHRKKRQFFVLFSGLIHIQYNSPFFVYNSVNLDKLIQSCKHHFNRVTDYFHALESAPVAIFSQSLLPTLISWPLPFGFVLNCACSV